MIRLFVLSNMLSYSLINKSLYSLIIIIIKFFSLNQFCFFHLLSNEISIIKLIPFLFSIFIKIRSVRNSFLLTLMLFLFLYILIIFILESRNHIVHIESLLIFLYTDIKDLAFHVPNLINNWIEEETYIIPRTNFIVAFLIILITLSVLH
jgi:hypothetical protein